MRVAGLASVDVTGVENVNVTEFVPGHMAYRAAMPKLLREVGWIVESDDEDEEGSGSQDDNGEMEGVQEKDEEEMQDLVVDDDQEMDSTTRGIHFEDLDNEEEEKQ